MDFADIHKSQENSTRRDLPLASNFNELRLCGGYAHISGVYCQSLLQVTVKIAVPVEATRVPVSSFWSLAAIRRWHSFLVAPVTGQMPHKAGLRSRGFRWPFQWSALRTCCLHTDCPPCCSCRHKTLSAVFRNVFHASVPHPKWAAIMSPQDFGQRE